MIIEDKEVVNSMMDGRPWEAGKFSLSLRLSLWAEHLGLQPGEVRTIIYSKSNLLLQFENYNNFKGIVKESTM